SATSRCEYFFHRHRWVIQSLSTLELTVARHFCSILKHESHANASTDGSCLFNSKSRRLPNRASCVPGARFGEASVGSLFTCQAHHEQIKNGNYDARDHDRVKIPALLHGLDQSRRIL